MATKEENIKLVIVGDDGVGKTSLIVSYINNESCVGNVPPVFQHYSSKEVIYGKTLHIDLWDTAGAEEYDRLRPLSYFRTDVFLICFDINNRDSFESVERKWIPEISSL